MIIFSLVRCKWCRCLFFFKNEVLFGVNPASQMKKYIKNHIYKQKIPTNHSYHSNQLLKNIWTTVQKKNVKRVFLYCPFAIIIFLFFFSSFFYWIHLSKKKRSFFQCLLWQIIFPFFFPLLHSSLKDYSKKRFNLIFDINGIYI